MSKENNKVSVLISTYNNEDCIRASVESIQKQTYKELEILIIDDGSNDGTLQICEDLRNDDSIIRVFKNENNIGLTKSLNILIKESKGKYIARQDADDISYSSRLEKQINFLKKQKLDIVYSRAKVKNSIKVLPNFSFYVPKKLILKYKNPFIHGTLLAKKNIVLLHNGYNENFYYAQDYKLIWDIIYSGGKVKIMREPLYILNMEENISSKYRDQQDYYALCVRNNKLPQKEKFYT